MIGGLSIESNDFIYKRLTEIRTVSLRFCLNCRTSSLLRQSSQGYRQAVRICLKAVQFLPLSAYKQWHWRALLSHSSIRASSFLMTLMLSISLGLMHRAKWMLGRRVKRIKLQGTVAYVNDVVPRACRDNDGIVTVHASLLLQIISATAHIDLGSAALYTNKLVNVVVHLNADITVNGNAHQR